MTKDELHRLKAKVEEVQKELSRLTDEELQQVFGGMESVYDDHVFINDTTYDLGTSKQTSDMTAILSPDDFCNTSFDVRHIINIGRK